MSITITLPDGTKKDYDASVTPLDVAKSIGEGLAKATRAANTKSCKNPDFFIALSQN